jgi:hypothetical protein
MSSLYLLQPVQGQEKRRLIPYEGDASEMSGRRRILMWSVIIAVAWSPIKDGSYMGEYAFRKRQCMASGEET